MYEYGEGIPCGWEIIDFCCLECPARQALRGIQYYFPLLQPHPPFLMLLQYNLILFLILLQYNLILYSSCCYNLVFVASTLSSITLLLNLILYFSVAQPYPLLLSVLPHPLLLSVATILSSIPYVATTSSSIPYVANGI